MAWKKLGLTLAILGLVSGLGGALSADVWGGTGSGTAIADASRLYTVDGEELVSQAASQQLDTFALALVTGEVKGKRLLVVDSDDGIIGIWSNTSSPDHTLIVREGGMDGPERLMTGDILRQYEELKDGIDWARRGLVFTSGS